MWTYKHCAALNILEDSDMGFVDKLEACLDEIRATPMGQRLLNAMNASGKTCTIYKSKTGHNKCVSGGYDRFVDLRQAFMGSPNFNLARTLTSVLAKAALGGMTRDAIAKRICNGISDVTVHNDQNISAPSQDVQANAAARFNKTGMFSSNSASSREKRAAELLDDLCSGKRKYIPKEMQSGGARRIEDDLVRILKPWCTAGSGAKARVDVNPDSEFSCPDDIAGTRRPPAVGICHELIHAWRNMAGLRFFDDAMACGQNDDEIMTTGIAPYLYEEFSENVFRSQWPGLSMRTDYRTYKAEAAMGTHA